MKTIKSLLIAFSLYSRIPIPRFDWEEDEYGHAISFLPLVGVVISFIQTLIYRGCIAVDIPVFVIATIMCIIPLEITGGFHLDGYMDVCDALGAWSGRKRSLEIMKDPHIGAFAVIGFARFSLLYMTGVYLVLDAAVAGYDAGVRIYVILPVLIRAMCGVSSILMTKARDNGMLNMEVSSGGNADLYVLVLQGAIAGVLMMVIDVVAAALVMAVLFFFCLYYVLLCDRKFGGVTGDTAGFFICRGELMGILALAVYYLVIRL